MDELFSKLKRPFDGTWDAVESDRAVFEYILFRLPVRSVLMFKSVSKFWYDVLSTNYFIALHRYWSKKNAKFFVFYDADDLEDDIVSEMHLMEPNGAYSESYTIPVFETLRSPLLIAAFNGLIFCMNDVIPYDTAYDVDLHICNPATREVLVLPKSHRSLDLPIIGVLYSNNYHVYKIFKFFSDPAEPEKIYSHCEVYSSITGEWKLLARVRSHPLRNYIRSVVLNHVCVNEKLYWFICENHEEDIDFPNSILMVDMEDNFRQIPLPTGADHAFLIELRGQLCFLNWLGLKFCLCLYNENNDCWYLLDIVKFPDNLLEVAKFYSVAAAHKDEILFVYRDFEGFRHEIWYDVGHVMWKDFHIAEDDKDKAIVVFPFFETLLPCKGLWE